MTEDDDTLLVSGLASIPMDESAIRLQARASVPEPEKCLVLGWNRFGATILRELNNYVPKVRRPW